MSDLTVVQLKDLCKAQNIKGYSNKRKSELIEMCLKKRKAPAKRKVDTKRKVNTIDKSLFSQAQKLSARQSKQIGPKKQVRFVLPGEEEIVGIGPASEREANFLSSEEDKYLFSPENKKINTDVKYLPRDLEYAQQRRQYQASSSTSKSCQGVSDKQGIEIFQIFDKKYRQADEIFDRALKTSLTLYNDGRLTREGLTRLTNVVTVYKEQYKKFIDNISTNRQFFEYSSSGKGARKIETSKDWAEALIEFINLINRFNADFGQHQKMLTDPENLGNECLKFTPNETQCQLPCNIRKSFFSSDKCVYDPQLRKKTQTGGYLKEKSQSGGRLNKSYLRRRRKSRYLVPIPRN